MSWRPHISRHVDAFLSVEADEDNPCRLSRRSQPWQGAGTEPPASLLWRLPPSQDLGPPPPVDLQVHAGVLQAGGPGEGPGPGVLSAVRPSQHDGPPVSDWWHFLHPPPPTSHQTFAGFIDFIVIPTLSTCGEMIKTVLGSADFHQPWTETLQENRSNWQKKVGRADLVGDIIQLLSWLRLMMEREVSTPRTPAMIPVRLVAVPANTNLPPTPTNSQSKLDLALFSPQSFSRLCRF